MAHIYYTTIVPRVWYMRSCCGLKEGRPAVRGKRAQRKCEHAALKLSLEIPRRGDGLEVDLQNSNMQKPSLRDFCRGPN